MNNNILKIMGLVFFATVQINAIPTTYKLDSRANGGRVKIIPDKIESISKPSDTISLQLQAIIPSSLNKVGKLNDTKKIIDIPMVVTAASSNELNAPIALPLEEIVPIFLSESQKINCSKEVIEPLRIDANEAIVPVRLQQLHDTILKANGDPALNNQNSSLSTYFKKAINFVTPQTASFATRSIEVLGAIGAIYLGVTIFKNLKLQENYSTGELLKAATKALRTDFSECAKRLTDVGVKNLKILESKLEQKPGAHYLQQQVDSLSIY